MQKKYAFSLTEVLMVIFAIAVIAYVILPMKIIDIHQAERIASWKSCYKELVYYYNFMKVHDNKLLDSFKNKNSSFFVISFFNSYIKNCNLDTKKSQNTNFSRYKLYYRNGKKVKHNTLYEPKQSVYLKNGVILTFVPFDNINNDGNSPVGILFVDINGNNLKNYIGRDVFLLEVYPDRLEPYGQKSSLQEMKEDCSPVGTGLKCSAYFLLGGSF